MFFSFDGVQSVPPLYFERRKLRRQVFAHLPSRSFTSGLVEFVRLGRCIYSVRRHYQFRKYTSQTEPHKDVKESVKENNKVKAKDADGDDESGIDEPTTLHVVTLEARMGQLEWPFVLHLEAPIGASSSGSSTSLASWRDSFSFRDDTWLRAN